MILSVVQKDKEEVTKVKILTIRDHPLCPQINPMCSYKMELEKFIHRQNGREKPESDLT
jgi:hypothetical protein